MLSTYADTGQEKLSIIYVSLHLRIAENGKVCHNVAERNMTSVQIKVVSIRDS